MNHVIRFSLLLALLWVAWLVVVDPQRMISPGALLTGHQTFATDCFACHAPLRGASSKKCISCHKVESIGVLTTKGVPLTEKKTKVPFHQKLLGKQCVLCHGDHQGVIRYRAAGRFSHQLLDEETRGQCVACHSRPGDSLHRTVTMPCSSCHGIEQWKPAQFKHDLLSANQRADCLSCHAAKRPIDALHRQTSTPCGSCHAVTHWKPATFDHRNYFTFDREHQVKCQVCHPQDRYTLYTCYGCHEHSVGKIRQEHVEEGIRDYERCVLCHRNADKDAAEWLWKSGRWRDGASGSLQPSAAGNPLWEPPVKRSRHKGHDDEKDDDDD